MLWEGRSAFKNPFSLEICSNGAPGAVRVVFFINQIVYLPVRSNYLYNTLVTYRRTFSKICWGN